jgi:hypothetical protein
MREINTQHKESLLSYATRLDEVSSQENPYFKIGSVIIVGGLLDENDALSDNDLLPLRHFLRICVSLGMRVSDDVSIQACNLKYEDDFIDKPPQADLLFFSWVNKDLNEPDDDKIGGESPLLSLGYTWQGAIAGSDSPLVAMVTDNFTCVGREDIPENYSLLRYKHRPMVYDYPLYQRS